MKKIDLTKYKFFINPCFVCSHIVNEYDDLEYSSHTWQECGRQFAHERDDYKEQEEYLFEIWSKKKDFPNVEAPNKCKRSGYFELGDFDMSQECDFWSLLHNCENALGVDFEDEFENPKNVLAREIANSISSFNQRLRLCKEIKDGC